jgi:hypothetical protein
VGLRSVYQTAWMEKQMMSCGRKFEGADDSSTIESKSTDDSDS